MKKILLFLLLLITPVYASEKAILQSSDGNAISASNPLQVTVVGGGSSQWTTNGSNIYYNTGNVGIGSINPLTAIDIGSGTLTANQINTGLSATGQIIAGTGFGLHLDVNSTTNALNISSSGNIGIGTTFSGSKITMGNQNANITNRIALYESDAAKDFYGIGMVNPSGSIFGVGIYADSSVATPTNSNMRVMIEQVNGNVGIGTFFPKLINGSVGRMVDIYGSSAGLALHNTTVPQEWLIYVGTGGSLRLYDASTGADKVTFDTSGNIGIGTASPGQTIDISGTSSKLRMRSADGTVWNCQPANSTGVFTCA